MLPILGIAARLDYDGKDGPAGHPDLKGFGAKGRMFFWLREGTSAPGAMHVGFVADSEAMVNSALPQLWRRACKGRRSSAHSRGPNGRTPLTSRLPARSELPGL